MIGSSSMISTSASVCRSISSSASATSESTSCRAGADQIGGVLRRKALERGQQQRLARQRRDPRQPRMGDAFGAGERLARLLAFLDIGGRPDRVEGPVQAEPRIDVARKFVGLGDDRLERCADESVAMGLAAGQRARVAAKKGQMRSEFLAKRHEWKALPEIGLAASLAARPELLQPWKDRSPPGLSAPPREVTRVWNKAPAIWFPSSGPARCIASRCQSRSRLGAYRALNGLRCRQGVARTVQLV